MKTILLKSGGEETEDCILQKHVMSAPLKTMAATEMIQSK